MRFVSAVSLFLGGLVLATGLATAQSARFSTKELADGLIITDTQTGKVTHCRGDAGAGFLCQLVPSDRAALEAEIDRLKSENEKLKSAQKPGPVLNLPSDQEVDKALSFMEKFMRRFRDVMQSSETPEKRI